MSKYEDITIPEPATLFDDYKGRGSAARDQDMSIDKTMGLRYDLKVGRGGQFAERTKKVQCRQAGRPGLAEVEIPNVHEGLPPLYLGCR